MKAVAISRVSSDQISRSTTDDDTYSLVVKHASHPYARVDSHSMDRHMTMGAYYRHCAFQLSRNTSGGDRSEIVHYRSSRFCVILKSHWSVDLLVGLPIVPRAQIVAPRIIRVISLFTSSVNFLLTSWQRRGRKRGTSLPGPLTRSSVADRT